MTADVGSEFGWAGCDMTRMQPFSVIVQDAHPASSRPISLAKLVDEFVGHDSAAAWEGIESQERLAPPSGPRARLSGSWTSGHGAPGWMTSR